MMYAPNNNLQLDNVLEVVKITQTPNYLQPSNNITLARLHGEEGVKE